MRFSRFKQHMEGVAPTPRKPRSDAGRARKAKAEKTTKKEKEAKRRREQEGLKSESTEMSQGVGGLGQGDGGFGQGNGGLVKPEPYVQPEPSIKPEPVIKAEPMDDAMDYERTEEPMALSFTDADGVTGETVPMQMQLEGDTEYISPYAPVENYRAGSAMSEEGRVSVKAEPVEM